METTVIPFRGLRYNTTQVDGIENVIAPPYDVIKTEERLALAARHPANIIRLILSQPCDDDTENANQYTRAAARMNRGFQTTHLSKTQRRAITSTTNRFVPRTEKLHPPCLDCTRQTRTLLKTGSSYLTKRHTLVRKQTD